MQTIPEITVEDLQKKLNEIKIIDVRRPDEWVGELGHIDGASFATLETDFEKTLETLPREKSYVFVCRSGGRSGRATVMALSKGFKSVFNMIGGMIEWNHQGFPVSKTLK